MKKLALVVLLLGASVFLFSQNNAPLNYSFRIKYSRVIQAPKLIETYAIRSLGLVWNNDHSRFEGVVPAFESEREGLNKTLYVAHISLDYTVIKEKAFFVVEYSSIEKITVVCDKNQTTTKEILETKDLSKSLQRHLDYVGDDIVDHIRDYVNKEEEELPQWFVIPDFFLVPYIIDDESVTYYSVLSSKSEMTKKQLYDLAEKFYTYEYRSGKAVIEIRDTERCEITGKGIYSDIYEDDGLTYSVPHIFSIQCRDGRVRATITISGIDVYGHLDKASIGVVGYFPYGTKDEDDIEETIVEAEKHIVKQFQSLQKAIDEGLTSIESIENW